MLFHATPIDGAFIIDIEQHSDDRGYFGRFFCENEMREQGIAFHVAQANVGFSHRKGTLRGMHYQAAPHQEAKLIRCTRGAVFDVVIDLRQESASFGKWYGTQLTATSQRMFHLPKGTAHGYLTLEDHTEVMYLVSEFYTPAAEKGIRWNDPVFSIQWPMRDDLIISQKDRQWPDFHL